MSDLNSLSHSGTADASDRALSALKGKQLQRSKSNLAHIYSMAMARHALIWRSKGQRSRSHGYENCNGHTAVSEECCCGHCAATAGIGWTCHM